MFQSPHPTPPPLHTSEMNSSEVKIDLESRGFRFSYSKKTRNQPTGRSFPPVPGYHHCTFLPVSDSKYNHDRSLRPAYQQAPRPTGYHPSPTHRYPPRAARAHGCSAHTLRSSTIAPTHDKDSGNKNLGREVHERTPTESVRGTMRHTRSITTSENHKEQDRGWAETCLTVTFHELPHATGAMIADPRQVGSLGDRLQVQVRGTSLPPGTTHVARKPGRLVVVHEI